MEIDNAHDEPTHSEQHDREFIRHPSDIPILVTPESAPEQLNLALDNISCGGLSFKSKQKLSKGTAVKIKIDCVRPKFRVKGVVAWCQEEGDAYHMGVEFMDQADAFKTRMIEQVCHIEHYKRLIANEESRRLTGEAAASEWIERFGSTFPGMSGSKTEQAT